MMAKKLTDLQDRMKIVMETQNCILSQCSDYYAEKSRQSVTKLNKEIGQARADRIKSARLKKMAGQVDTVEETQVGLLKSSCQFCAK